VEAACDALARARGVNSGGLQLVEVIADGSGEARLGSRPCALLARAEVHQAVHTCRLAVGILKEHSVAVGVFAVFGRGVACAAYTVVSLSSAGAVVSADGGGGGVGAGKAGLTSLRNGCARARQTAEVGLAVKHRNAAATRSLGEGRLARESSSSVVTANEASDTLVVGSTGGARAQLRHTVGAVGVGARGATSVGADNCGLASSDASAFAIGAVLTSYAATIKVVSGVGGTCLTRAVDAGVLAGGGASGEIARDASPVGIPARTTSGGASLAKLGRLRAGAR